MLRATLTVLTYFTVVAAFAQSASLQGSDANSNLSDASTSMFRTFDNRYKGVVGSSTIFEDFRYGTVYLKDSTRVVDQQLNYDAIADELIVNSAKFRRVMAVRKDLVSAFDVEVPASNGQDVRVLHFKKITDIGLCEVVYDGKTKFYRKHGKRLIKANYGGAYNANAKAYDELVDDSSYVIVTADGTVNTVTLTKKSIVRLFPDKAAQMSAYNKEAKPNFKKTEDIVALLKHIDAIN